jgi:HD superfamily phosphohydrolase
MTSYVFDQLAPRLIRVNGDARATDKDLNDAVWKLVRLSPLIVELLNQPLLQRLRYVRQLGLVHLVYPGACHSRLDHSIGAMAAAQRMYDALASTCAELKDQTVSAGFREVVSVAALLHDTGHTAFSHAGERVLGRLVETEVAEAGRILNKAYATDDGLHAPAGVTSRNPKLSGAAELVSALLVLSPAMQAFLTQHARSFPPPDFALKVAALILGKPWKLTVGQHEIAFISSIVSGDLDADKLDYVARDAYFAGVPISADVDRLVSQLVAAPVTRTTSIQGHENFEFKPPGLECSHVLALRRSGVSAFEMFVMTRSYLFERIYGHQKVRAAEKLLERAIGQYAGALIQHEQKRLSDVLDLLFMPTGDDGLLQTMLQPLPCDPDGDLRKSVQRILDRDLPVRALAVALRTSADYRHDVTEASIETITSWAQVRDAITENPQIFEAAVSSACGPDEANDIFVDLPRFNPVSEDPAVYIWDHNQPTILSTASLHFNVEQLANAYRDVKQNGWIFTSRHKRDILAAEAALQLAREYDFLVGKEAFRRAKVYDETIEDYLKTKEFSNPRDKKVLNNLRCKIDGDRILMSPPNYYTGCLDILDQPTGIVVGSRLSKDIIEVGFPRVHSDDLSGALNILNFLICHANTTLQKFASARSRSGRREKAFQKDIIEFFGNNPMSKHWDLTEGELRGAGIADLIFRRKLGLYKPIVVELKSALNGFDEMAQQHGGQAQHYAGADYARVTILYCQFKLIEARSAHETIHVRKNRHCTDQIVLCVGQNAFGGHPSRRGGTTERVTAPS